MNPRKTAETPKRRRKPETQARRGSWTALLAATTLGVAGISTVHAEVRSDARLDASRTYRLIVQSYDRASAGMRPVASMQRAVTEEELRSGVKVGLVELRQGRKADDGKKENQNLAKALVLAWVEEGKPDLEFDALRARPAPGSIQGVAHRTADETPVRISVGQA